MGWKKCEMRYIDVLRGYKDLMLNEMEDGNEREDKYIVVFDCTSDISR